MKYRFLKIVLLTSALLPLGKASADLFGFDCITLNDLSACAIGEAQFALEVNAIGDPDTGGISMLFTNTEQNPPDKLANGDNPNPSITELYFDTRDDDLGLFTTLNVDDPTLSFPPGAFNTQKTTLTPSTFVFFDEGESISNNKLKVSPLDLPGGESIGFTGNWAAEATNTSGNGQSTFWGIQEGQSLQIDISTLSLNIFLAALNAGDFNIGMHVRAFEGGAFDSSESFVIVGANPIPLPASLWLFGTALIGFIGFARRTRV